MLQVVDSAPPEPKTDLAIMCLSDKKILCNVARQTLPSALPAENPQQCACEAGKRHQIRCQSSQCQHTVQRSQRATVPCYEGQSYSGCRECGHDQQQWQHQQITQGGVPIERHSPQHIREPQRCQPDRKGGARCKKGGGGLSHPPPRLSVSLLFRRS